MLHLQFYVSLQLTPLRFEPEEPTDYAEPESRPDTPYTEDDDDDPAILQDSNTGSNGLSVCSSNYGRFMTNDLTDVVKN